jgi:hypothetical protein
MRWRSLGCTSLFASFTICLTFAAVDAPEKWAAVTRLNLLWSTTKLKDVMRLRLVVLAVVARLSVGV